MPHFRDIFDGVYLFRGHIWPWLARFEMPTRSISRFRNIFGGGDDVYTCFVGGEDA